MLDDLRNLLEAELATAANRREWIAALEDHWVSSRRLEAVYRVRFKAGTIAPDTYHRVQRAWLEADYRHAKAQTEKD